MTRHGGVWLLLPPLSALEGALLTVGVLSDRG